MYVGGAGLKEARLHGVLVPWGGLCSTGDSWDFPLEVVVCQKMKKTNKDFFATTNYPYQ